MINLFLMRALCNRLRALNAGIGLAKDLNTDLCVSWIIRNTSAPFRFLDIFEPIDRMQINENQIYVLNQAIYSLLVSKNPSISMLKRSFMYLYGYDYVIDFSGYKIMNAEEKNCQIIQKYFS